MSSQHNGNHLKLAARPCFVRGVPNENKMRHNLPFWNKIAIEIQNLSPLAWSRRNEFFRSRSRSRLRNSHSVCLQTLLMLFFLHFHCFKNYKLWLLYADWYFDVSLVAFYQDKPSPWKNTKPNNKHNKKELSNLMQSFWSYARTYILPIHFYSYC